MARLPRWAPQQKVTGEDLNLLAGAIDAGGFLNLSTATNVQGTTGQGLTPTTPATPGSTTPPPGSQGAPQTPTGLTARYGIDYFSQTHDAYILLSWTPNPVSDFVAHYDLYWHKGSDPNLHNLTVGGDVTSARINSMIPGQTYLFAIQAHDTAGRSSNFSPEVPITISLDVDPPAVPSGLTVTPAGGGIYLKWTEVGSEGTSNDLKQYQVAISTDGGVTYPTLETAGPQSHYFWLPSVATTNPVYFKVASVDWTGNISAYSSPVSASFGTIIGPITIASLVTIGATNPSAQQLRVTGGMTLDEWSSGDQNFYISSGTAVQANFQLPVIIAPSAGVIPLIVYRPETSAGNYAFLYAQRNTAVKWMMGLDSSDVFALFNGAGSAVNLEVSDPGVVTTRNAINVPPSASGTVAATSYGTVPVKISETLLGSAQASVTFSSLPTGFRHLLIQWYARGDTAALNTEIKLTFNNDTGNNYDFQTNLDNGATTWTVSETLGTSHIRVGQFPANTATAAFFGQGEIKIVHYGGTIGNKLASGECTWGENNSTSTAGRNAKYGGKWRTTATAVNRIDLTPVAGNFVSGSLFTLYGIP